MGISRGSRDKTRDNEGLLPAMQAIISPHCDVMLAAVNIMDSRAIFTVDIGFYIENMVWGLINSSLVCQKY